MTHPEEQSTLVQVREEVEVLPQDLSGDYAEDQEELYANPAEPSQVSLSRIIAIIIKTIIGAHIVLIPYTATQLGFVTFPIVLFSIIGIHHFTSVLLLKCKNICRHSNFSTILYSIWHHFASKLFGATLMMFNNLAFCILQFVLIKQTLVNIVAQLKYQGSWNKPLPQSAIYDKLFDCQNVQGSQCWYTYQGIFFVAVMGAIQFPFIFTRKIQKLRIFSIIGVIGIFAYIIAVIGFTIYIIVIDQRHDNEGFEPFVGGPNQIASSTALIILALNFHMNFFPIYKGLRKPTDVRMKRASIIGLTSCAVIYTIVGLLGYYFLGSVAKNKPNFLTFVFLKDKNNNPNPFFWLLNISYLISIMFNVVLMFFTCKTNFINIVNIIRKQRQKRKRREFRLLNGSSEVVDSEDESSRNSNKSKMKTIDKQMTIFTTLLYIVFIIGSMFLHQLQIIFSFLGAICSTTMVVLLPCIFYVMLIYKHKQPRHPIFYASFITGILSIPFIAYAAVVIILEFDTQS